MKYGFVFFGLISFGLQAMGCPGLGSHLGIYDNCSQNDSTDSNPSFSAGNGGFWGVFAADNIKDLSRKSTEQETKAQKQAHFSDLEQEIHEDQPGHDSEQAPSTPHNSESTRSCSALIALEKKTKEDSSESTKIKKTNAE